MKRLSPTAQKGVPLLKWLAELLRGENEDMWKMAVEAVNAIRSAAATPKFLACLDELLDDPEWRIRWGTAEVLAHLMAQGIRVFKRRRWFFKRQDGTYEGRTVAELSRIDD
jgi:hypothetical protein